MSIDLESPLNQGVLRYLSRPEKPQTPVIATPDSVKDPYADQGSHPDIVQRVWDELAAGLPGRCKRLVYGTPALVHDRSGIVIAICNGTQYNLRLTGEDLREALRLGARTRLRWSTGDEMDCQAVLGADWVFGGWFKQEPAWCGRTYEACGGGAAPDTQARADRER
jgi:hypothetical protein